MIAWSKLEQMMIQIIWSKKIKKKVIQNICNQIFQEALACSDTMITSDIETQSIKKSNRNIKKMK